MPGRRPTLLLTMVSRTVGGVIAESAAGLDQVVRFLEERHAVDPDGRLDQEHGSQFGGLRS